MTLTEAAFWTKRFGVIAGGALLVFLIIILIITSVNRSKNMPPAYLSANFACTETKEEFLENKLSIPTLKLADGSEMLFEIKTESGKIDSLPRIINVYKFSNPTQSLSSQADSKILAKKLGFNPDAVIRRGTESYVWVDRNTSRTLEIQAKNLNFSLKTDTQYIRTQAKSGTLPTQQEAKSKAVNLLRSLGFFSEDYATGIPTTTLIDVNPDGSFSQAASLSEAELIRVDFKRSKSMITIASNIVGADSMAASLTRKLGEPTQETPIINDERLTVYTFNTRITTLNPNKSNISVYIGVPEKSSDTLAGIYQIDYTYWPIQETNCGTYELVSPQYAIQQVQSGNGSLVYLNKVGGDNVVDYIPKRVTKFSVFYINLTYYESPLEQNYLQPVYVVSGEVIFDDGSKGEFDYYYPAINYTTVQDKIVLPEPEVKETNSLF